MIDGRPDASGRRIAARGTLLMTFAISAANLAGASVVLFLSLYAVPTPEVDNQGAVYAANFITFGVFMLAAIATGILWGRRRLYPMRAWPRDDRAPDEAEQRLTLRAPRRVLLVNASLWTLAIAVFFGVNAAYSVPLAIVVAIIVSLGGLTTSAVSYLLSERILRPTVARALSHRAPRKPVTLGIVTRSLSAWALGTGIPPSCAGAQTRPASRARATSSRRKAGPEPGRASSPDRRDTARRRPRLPAPPRPARPARPR